MEPPKEASDIPSTPSQDSNRLLPINEFINSQAEAYSLAETREEIIQLYRDIAKQTGLLGSLVYAASAGDAFPIISTNRLIMVDKSPLFNNKDKDIVDQLLVEKEEGINLLEVFSQTSDVEKMIENEALIHLNMYRNIGFQQVGIPHTIWSILGSLYVLGVDVDQVIIQKFSDGYSLVFELEGKKKQIFYSQAAISGDSEKNQQLLSFISQAQSQVAEEKNGMIIKADQNYVCSHLIPTLAPDVLIMDCVDDDYEVFGSYEIEHLKTDMPDFNIRFGYRANPKAILIGQRKTQRFETKM